MSTTLLDVITESLLDLGVIEQGGAPDAGQAASGLSASNNLVDQWKAENLLIYTTTRTAFSLVSALQDYTLGLGQGIVVGGVDIGRPVFVDRVTYQDSALATPIEISLGPLLTDQQWEGLAIKSLTNTVPSKAYYNPTFPYGTLSFWPIPTSSTLEGVIYALTAIEEFATISDVLSLPPGYRRMLVKNLALELAPSYQREPSPLLLRQAANAKTAVQRANTRIVELRFEAAALPQGNGFPFNFRTGE